MNIVINRTITRRYSESGGTYLFADMTVGKHSALVTIAPHQIRVQVRNASNRTWRGLGRSFLNLPDALAYYKTPAIRAMVQAAADKYTAEVSANPFLVFNKEVVANLKVAT